MRVNQSRPLNPFPDFSGVKDEVIKKVFNDLAEALIKIHRNISDDIGVIQNLDTVESLPTATAEYRGRMVLLKGVGTGADKLYLGVNTGGAGFTFKEIAI